MNTKLCKTCNQNKTIDNFTKNPKGKYGVHSTCKACKNAKDYKTKRLAHNIKKHNVNMQTYMDNNPAARIAANLRSRMRQVLKGKVKSARTLELLGCSAEEWVTYLENQFKDGMNWDNYGKWEIDHIVPCCSFDLSKKSQQKECFHYTNTQPLWKKDNASKGGRTGFDR